MSDAEGKLVELRRKVLRRFYEPLLLLNALGQVRGERIKPALDSDLSGPNHRNARRSFADGIAYISAYDRGPDYVTAVALERSPQGTIVWLAANAEIKPIVFTFLQSILNDLGYIAAQSKAVERSQMGMQMHENILARVVEFNEARLQGYYKTIRGFTKTCLGVIRETIQSHQSGQEEQTELSKLENWLCVHFPYNRSSVLEESDLQILVRECHNIRRDTILRSLKLFTGQGQTRRHEFEQLYKLLCKLGKHVTISRKLIESTVLLPQDFNQGFVIKTVPSSKLQKLPLLTKEATVESTAGRMFTDSDEKNKFLSRLQSVWDAHELSGLLQKEIPTKTRVHAELLLVNHFDKHGCTFLDGSDKYIGCSKPACYLCYAYISNHPGRYALPASHQKIYVAWRVPDVYSDEAQSHERSSIQENVLLKMIEQVRQDLKTDMESREPRRPFHADSTAGITSVVDFPAFDVTNLLSALSIDDAPVNASEEGFSNINDSDIAEYEQSYFEDSDDDGGVRLY